MEIGALEKFTTSLKYVAQSPLALLGLFVIAGLWAFYIFKKKQVEESKERLSIIEKLHTRERSKALDNEYKTVPRNGISSQQWLTSQKHKLFLVAFVGTLFFIATIIISALWFSSAEHFENTNEPSKTESTNSQTNINASSNTKVNSNVSQNNQIVLPSTNQTLNVTNQVSIQPSLNTLTNTIQNISMASPQAKNSNSQLMTQTQQKLVDPNSNKVNVTAEQLEALLRKTYPEGKTEKFKNLSPEAKQDIENIKSQLNNLDDEALTMSFANFSDAYRKAKTWYDNCAITLGKADIWMRKYYQIDTKYRHDFEDSTLYIHGDSDDEKIKWLKSSFELQLSLLRVGRASINSDLVQYN